MDTNTSGKLIVIEGSDGSGKGTQADLALAALKQAGEVVTYFDFPQYTSSRGGKLVKEALTGVYGDFVSLHPKLASLPYTIDRLSAKDALITALRQGTVICNRYVPSNSAHQGAKIIVQQDTQRTLDELFETIEVEQDAFVEWLEGLEYDELKLPRPDLTFFLHVPFEVANELMEERERDQHESNEWYLKKVIMLYLRIAQSRDDWRVIECVENGMMRSREDIHAEIMGHIRTLR